VLANTRYVGISNVNRVASHLRQGYEYSRSGNPNRDQLERLLASIEAGGGDAVAFASGSATTATVLQALGPNAHIVSVNDVYGGTFRYVPEVLKRKFYQ
jgi:cystathionine gamma-lyase